LFLFLRADLFAASDSDDDGLFSTRPRASGSHKPSSTTPSGASLANDGGDKAKTSVLTKPTLPTHPAISPGPSSSLLFPSSKPSSALSSSTSASRTAAAVTTKSVDLFGDSDDEDLFGAAVKSVKAPAVAVAVKPSVATASTSLCSQT
jgi:hypothetical protein